MKRTQGTGLRIFHDKDICFEVGMCDICLLTLNKVLYLSRKDSPLTISYSFLLLVH